MESFYKPISAQNEGGIEALQTARKLKEERKQNTLKNIDSVNPTISKEARRIAIDEGWIEDNPDTISNTANGLDDMRKAVASTTATEKPYQETGGDPSQIKNNILKKGELGYNEQKNSTEKATVDYESRLAKNNYWIDKNTGNMYRKVNGQDVLYATSDNFTGQDKADQYNKDMAMPGLGADQKAYDAQTKADTAADDMISSELSNPSTDVKSLREKIASIPKAQAEADKAKKAVTDLGSQYGDTAERAAIESRQQQDTKDAQGIAAEKAQRAISEALNIDDVYRRAFNEVGTAQQAYSLGMDFLEKNGASAETLKNYQRKFERQELTQDRGAYINPNEDMGKAQKATGRGGRDVVSKATYLDGRFNYHSSQPFQKDYADAVRNPALWDTFIDKMVDATGEAGTAQEKTWRALKTASPEAKRATFKTLLDTAVTDDSQTQTASAAGLTILPEDEKAAREAGRPGDAAAFAEERQGRKAKDLSLLRAIKEADDLFDASPEGKKTYFLESSRRKALNDWKIKNNLPVAKD